MSSIRLDHREKCKDILNRLIELVKICLEKYGGKKELASESDELIKRLCEIWEEIVVFGLKDVNRSVLNEFTDVFKIEPELNESVFWSFCQSHLTHHERERFNSLKQVWTDRGRIKSVLRNALNEHSLQRSLLMWLDDPALRTIYEPWAVMVDKESTNLLPSLAGGLNTILFGVTIDSTELNSVTKFGSIRKEPVISASIAVGPTKKISPVERDIVSLIDNDAEDVVKLLDAEQNNENAFLQSSLPVSSSSSAILNESLHSDTENVNNVSVISANSDNSLENTVDFQPNSSITEIELYLQNMKKEEEEKFDNDDADSSISESSYLSKSSSNLNNTNGLPEQSCSHVNIKNIEQQLQLMTERCTFLEARVAELSLENQQLKRLGNFLTNDFRNYTITIPKKNLVASKHSQYYEYEIHIKSREQENWIIGKRYSEFNKLHQEMLKKHYELVSPIDFPPKKKLGNMNSSFVEDRRQRLQIYLRHLLEVLPEITLCTSKEELQYTIPFFK